MCNNLPKNSLLVSSANNNCLWIVKSQLLPFDDRGKSYGENWQCVYNNVVHTTVELPLSSALNVINNKFTSTFIWTNLQWINNKFFWLFIIDLWKWHSECIFGVVFLVQLFLMTPKLGHVPVRLHKNGSSKLLLFSTFQLFQILFYCWLGNNEITVKVYNINSTLFCAN